MNFYSKHLIYYLQIFYKKINLNFSCSDQILTIQFMRKYIHIARCLKPKLTEEASIVIAEEYSKLRSEDVIESDVARVSRICFRFKKMKNEKYDLNRQSLHEIFLLS